MSREIKFRGWDGHCMHPAEDLTTSPGYREWLGKVDFELMQYTGIKDKNGGGENDLYKDDLVECYGHGIGRVDQNNWGEWCIFFPEQYEGEGPYDACIHDLIMEQDLGVLVGNIHENPELLEADND